MSKPSPPQTAMRRNTRDRPISAAVLRAGLRGRGPRANRRTHFAAAQLLSQGSARLDAGPDHRLLTIFNLPWIIKPVYGLISDFVPLFGYRRKSYLLIANVAAIGGLLWATRIVAPSELVLALHAHGLCDGDIEHAVRRRTGRERPKVRRERRLRQSAMALVQHRVDGRRDPRRPTGSDLAPTSALHIAAAMSRSRLWRSYSAPCFSIPEEKVAINRRGHESTLAGLMAAFKSARTVDRSPSSSFSTISVPG